MPTKAKINKPANHTVFTYFSCNVSKHKMIKNFKIKMDLIDERRKLSELTETALVKNDIESLKKIKKIVDQKKMISTHNFSEFFYSMVPSEILQKISKK